MLENLVEMKPTLLNLVLCSIQCSPLLSVYVAELHHLVLCSFIINLDTHNMRHLNITIHFSTFNF